MRLNKLIFIAIVSTTGAAVHAGTKCMPETYGTSKVRELSQRQNQSLCESAERGLRTVVSPRMFAKIALASYLINKNGGENIDDLAFQLASMVRLRGQSQQIEAAEGTVEIGWKAFNGTNGRVTPRKLVAFLLNSPDLAKTLSDDGLIDIAALLANMN